MVDLEEEEDDKDSLEYETDVPSMASYMTPPSTGGHSKPSHHPLCSLTPVGSDPEDNTALHTAKIEACTKVFLEEAEEDMELDNLPLLKNVTPVPIYNLTIPGFIPFALSTSQHCIPPKNLLWKVFHPYQDSVGQCHCEPGGWYRASLFQSEETHPSKDLRMWFNGWRLVVREILLWYFRGTL